MTHNVMEIVWILKDGMERSFHFIVGGNTMEGEGMARILSYLLSCHLTLPNLKRKKNKDFGWNRFLKYHSIPIHPILKYPNNGILQISKYGLQRSFHSIVWKYIAREWNGKNFK